MLHESLAKFGKIGRLSSFVPLAFQNGLHYRNADFKTSIICDDLSTSCKNLVKLGPVTQEIKRDIGVQPLINQQLATFTSQLDLAGIGT